MEGTLTVLLHQSLELCEVDFLLGTSSTHLVESIRVGKRRVGRVMKSVAQVSQVIPQGIRRIFKDAAWDLSKINRSEHYQSVQEWIGVSYKAGLPGMAVEAPKRNLWLISVPFAQAKIGFHILTDVDHGSLQYAKDI